MNTKKLFSFSLLMALALSMSLFAANAPQHVGELNIPLHPVPSGGTHPRIPGLVPIQCNFLNGILTFSYMANLGLLQCDVVRQSDQAVAQATFNACADGSDSLYVSEEAGDYLIMLTTADSTQYTGEYVLDPADPSGVGYAVLFGNSLPGGYVASYNGSVIVNGAVVAPSLMVPSDPELMSDINDLDSKRGYQGIMALAPLEYVIRQEETSTATPAFGLLADEVEQVYPELVREDSLGNKQVDYAGLIPLLIQTVQHLSSEVGVLQQTLENVRANIAANNTSGMAEEGFFDQEACVSVDGSCEITYSLPETTQVAMLYIYGISGKMVGSYSLDGRGNGKLVVDTSRFGKGSYIYTLIADGRSVASRQMIVQ